ncbi:MAG: hypothetical protein WCI46_11645 [Verrucomicrobiota bacterium]
MVVDGNNPARRMTYLLVSLCSLDHGGSPSANPKGSKRLAPSTAVHRQQRSAQSAKPLFAT